MEWCAPSNKSVVIDLIVPTNNAPNFQRLFTEKWIHHIVISLMACSSGENIKLHFGKQLFKFSDFWQLLTRRRIIMASSSPPSVWRLPAFFQGIKDKISRWMKRFNYFDVSNENFSRFQVCYSVYSFSELKKWKQLKWKRPECKTHVQAGWRCEFERSSQLK